MNLVVADDHHMVRQGLCALLQLEPDFRLAGEAADGVEALRLVERLRPDVLVLDLMMPGLGGLEVARQTARRSPRTRTVVVSMHKDEAYVVEALRVGAAGYVLKDCGSDDLFRAVREAAAGRRFLCPCISEAALRAYVRTAQGASADPFGTLTNREREVFQLTAEGHSGGAVADASSSAREPWKATAQPDAQAGPPQSQGADPLRRPPRVAARRGRAGGGRRQVPPQLRNPYLYG